VTITITAFEASPDDGQGLARDMRVRWALEELGLPYAVELVSFAAMKADAHRAKQPFGQIPTFEEDGLVLFESGAIVLHVAERHPGLLPGDIHARERAKGWLFAALNTVEPPIVERETAIYAEGRPPWFAERLALVDARIRTRLDDLARRLGDAAWLDGAFSVGNLMMVLVLRRLEGAIIGDYPTLAAYVARGEARPAYGRAFADQRAVFEASRAGG
jgi:glutathione S-transferase